MSRKSESMSRKSEPSLLDLKEMDIQLVNAIQEYEAKRMEMGALIKQSIDNGRTGSLPTQEDEETYRGLSADLSTGAQSIRDDLVFIGQKTKELREAQKKDRKHLAKNAARLQEVTAKLKSERARPMASASDLASRMGAQVSSYLQAESANARMMVMVFATIAVFAATLLAAFKPEYMGIAYGIGALCALAAAYYGFKYIFGSIRQW